ncbi:MAG: hypothetical protein KKA64_01810 [Nanoarchaeota archaeon]|nr:hypothetical protein [Nanoarchaeota archaeon]
MIFKDESPSEETRNHIKSLGLAEFLKVYFLISRKNEINFKRINGYNSKEDMDNKQGIKIRTSSLEKKSFCSDAGVKVGLIKPKSGKGSFIVVDKHLVRGKYEIIYELDRVITEGNEITSFYSYGNIGLKDSLSRYFDSLDKFEKRARKVNFMVG